MAAQYKHLVVALAVLFLMYLLSCPADAGGNVLLQGYELSPGAELDESPCALSMQHDCNLVLYHSGTPIWATNTQGHATECYFIMENDGNAVVYSGSGTPLWSTSTNGRNDGDHYLILQSDGNLAMYNGGGTAIWATGTYGEGLPTGVDGRQLLPSSSPAGTIRQRSRSRPSGRHSPLISQVHSSYVRHPRRPSISFLRGTHLRHSLRPPTEIIETILEAPAAGQF